MVWCGCLCVCVIYKSFQFCVCTDGRSKNFIWGEPIWWWTDMGGQVTRRGCSSYLSFKVFSLISECHQVCDIQQKQNCEVSFFQKYLFSFWIMLCSLLLPHLGPASVYWCTLYSTFVCVDVRIRIYMYGCMCNMQVRMIVQYPFFICTAARTWWMFVDMYVIYSTQPLTEYAQCVTVAL